MTAVAPPPADDPAWAGAATCSAAPDGPDAGPPPWPGTWVRDRLGVRLRAPRPVIGPRFDTTLVADDRGPLAALLGLALRRNPRRAHLLVSTVLGKHVPQRPEVVHGSGLDLGARVRAVLGADTSGAVVLGYAETATGLGHCVAEALHAPYLHSTRRPVPGVAPVGGFEEEHSHATSHLLLPHDPQLLLGGDGPLVLVDDELSTGRTVMNTIRTLHRATPRTRYVIASLVDVRDDAARTDLARFAATLGTRIDTVALARGTVDLPDGVLERGARLVEQHHTLAPAPAGHRPAGGLGAAGGRRQLHLDWPQGLPDGGRHGFAPAHHTRLAAALPALGRELAAQVRGPRVLVLGFEELMYTPLRLAGALADQLSPAAEVRFSTTTRSPVLAVDDPGYAIRTRLEFPAHDDPADGPGPRYAYNVAAGGRGAPLFDEIVLVVDEVANTPALHAGGGLVDRLAESAARVGWVVLPSAGTPVDQARTVGSPRSERSHPSEGTALSKGQR